MGLDFRGADAHWSYGGFHRFRERIAKIVNIDLNEMEGFTTDGTGMSFPLIEEEPLVILLDHSDCDDDIHPEQLKLLAPRFEEVLNILKESVGEVLDYDCQEGFKLLKGMKECIENNERLQFC